MNETEKHEWNRKWSMLEKNKKNMKPIAWSWLEHVTSAPFLTAEPFNTFNRSHLFVAILHWHCVFAKFHPRPFMHVIFALSVQSGAKPGMSHFAWHTEPPQLHLPPRTGCKSVDSQISCAGVVVVFAGALVGFVLLTWSPAGMPKSGTLASGCDDLLHRSRVVSLPCFFQE